MDGDQVSKGKPEPRQQLGAIAGTGGKNYRNVFQINLTVDDI